MWCVVADNGEEYWVYGLWVDQDKAEEFAAKAQAANPGIEYTAGQFMEPEALNGEQENNSAA